MATNVRTEDRNLVTQYCASHCLQPADPVFLKPKSDPGAVPHFNISTKVNNPAGTVFDHGTLVAHEESYLGAGKHVPVVIKGIKTNKVDGDTGFWSNIKNLYVEGRKAVADAVDATVNAAWNLLPQGIKNIVQNGGQVVGGLSGKHFSKVAAEEGAAMLEALKSTDTLIALAQTAALMGVSAIPVVGQLAGGAAAVQRIKSVIESSAGAADEFKAMMERWSKPMSPEQLEAEREKLASFILRLGVSSLLAALGKALPKLSKKSTGNENSVDKHKAGTKDSPHGTQCACAIGRPVIIATGEKSIEHTDFELPGLIDIQWLRKYRSGDVRTGWFGQGWSTPYDVSLHLAADGVRYHDAMGREVSLPFITVGAEHFDAYEQFTLKRPSQDHWQVAFKSGLTQSFIRPREDHFSLPLQSITDRNNNCISFEYPAAPDDPFASWRPRSITDSVGRKLKLSWTTQGQLTAVHWRADPNAPLQGLAEYRYDAAGCLQAHANAIGAKRQYEWQNQVLVAYTEPDGARYCAEYDELSPFGRVTRSYAQADGRGLRFAYNDRARTTTVTDGLGRSTVYEFDARKDIVATTGPDGTRLATPFDSNGHPRGSTDALGRSTAYRFDARGNLTDMVDPSGAKTHLDYSALDLPHTIIDALGHAWKRDYDARGNLITSTDPLKRTTRYEIQSRGLPQRIIDAKGGIKHLQWDKEGNLTAWTDCSNKRSKFDYDAQGRLITLTDALGQQTHHDWDAAGRLIQVTDPSGSTHRYEWSAEGRLNSYTDPLKQTTAWRYNSHGEPIQRTDANGHVLRYAYDDVGRLITLQNENGAKTHFSYDTLDQLTDEIGFDGRHQRYIYNAAGELTHLIETGGTEMGPGKVTHFQRDALGRLTKKTADGTEDCTSQFAYDALGRLTQANNQAAQLAFAYDPVGQLLSEAQTLGANSPTRQLKHAYDELGNRTLSQLPDGRSLHWLFYGSGHLHQINLQDKDGKHHLISDIERDALHREVGRSQGHIASQFEHDPMGRLTRHKASLQGKASQAIVERSYTYDAAGQLIGRTDKQRGAQAFKYDKVGYILAALPGQGGSTKAEMFNFDPAGNLLDDSKAASTDPLRDNRLRFYQDLHFEYDAHGNTTKRTRGNQKAGNHTSTELIWNADHQLQEAKVTRHGVTQTTTYEYDALGRRTRKTDAFGSTEFLWDGDLMIHSQRGNKQALFIYEPNSFVPLATVQNDQTYWYHNDQIGAPQELTDEQGQVVWAADYKVWGEATIRTLARTGTDDMPARGAWPSIQAAPSSASAPVIEQPFRFQGQQFDEESGLHYNRFRYYDPVVGRFASQDPIGLAGGPNGSAYGPNALNWIDVLGLSGNSADRRKARRAEKRNAKPCPDKCPCPTSGHLYRGVSADHPALDAAKQGRAEPALNSGGSTAAQHNAGGHSGSSQYTSWTRSLDYAKVHANKSGPGGVVLSAPLGAPGPGDCWSWEFSDDIYHEQEVLLKGPRSGLGVHKP